jgi:hypothetical protein
MTVTVKSAAGIPVECYRQILFLPLHLKQVPLPSNQERQGQLEPWLAQLRDPWFEKPTLPKTVTPERGDDITYEEMVYFHPFVRDFLYGDGSGDERPLVRLTRSDISSIEVQLGDGPTVTLKIPRMELYLCKPLVAVLVIEVAEPIRQDGHPFSLADALRLQSQLRQVFPPFFQDEKPGNCPRRVAFRDGNGLEFAVSDFGQGREHFARFTHCGAEPPVASHWQSLLEPLRPYQGDVQGENGFWYQQIEDDRMPGMTFVGVKNPREIRGGDFDRLTWGDYVNPWDGPYPYAADFLKSHRAEHTYDRFWDKLPGDDAVGNDTRYLCSGYQFVAVVKAGHGNSSWFQETILQDHFRRHYFRMGLLLHYQRAALLKFQDDLAEAVKLISGQHTDDEWGNPEFRARVSHIQMTFLKFRTRAGFTEVSNQLQGREIYAWWLKLLGTDKLFGQVDGECQRLHSGLAEYETRDLARLAGWGIPVSIAVGVGSLFASFLSQEKWSQTPYGMQAFISIFLIICAIAYAGCKGYCGRRIQKMWNPQHR